MKSATALDYWQKQPASIYGMMLNPEAEELHHSEREQIINCLPSLLGKKVLELGAGIGRFTNHFAAQAHWVTAVDFNEDFIAKNREVNSEFSNISYQCDDVTSILFAKESFDFIFINWLLMYLRDEDVDKVFALLVEWLKQDGMFFLRESCITDSKGRPPKISTASDAQHSHFYSHYRDPEFYLERLRPMFSTLFQGHIHVYEEKYNNSNQLFWLFQKR